MKFAHESDIDMLGPAVARDTRAVTVGLQALDMDLYYIVPTKDDKPVLDKDFECFKDYDELAAAPRFEYPADLIAWMHARGFQLVSFAHKELRL